MNFQIFRTASWTKPHPLHRIGEGMTLDSMCPYGRGVLIAFYFVSVDLTNFLKAGGVDVRWCRHNPIYEPRHWFTNRLRRYWPIFQPHQKHPSIIDVPACRIDSKRNDFCLRWNCGGYPFHLRPSLIPPANLCRVTKPKTDGNKHVQHDEDEKYPSAIVARGFHCEPNASRNHRQHRNGKPRTRVIRIDNAKRHIKWKRQGQRISRLAHKLPPANGNGNAHSRVNQVVDD